MRIFENASFNIVGSRRKAYMLSGTLLLLSFASFMVRGLEMGIDFKGGMEFVVESRLVLEATEVRLALADVLGTEPEVKTYSDVGEGGDALLIRTLAGADINQVQQQIIQGIEAAFPQAQPQVIKTDIVGPRFVVAFSENGTAVAGGRISFDTEPRVGQALIGDFSFTTPAGDPLEPLTVTSGPRWMTPACSRSRSMIRLSQTLGSSLKETMRRLDIPVYGVPSRLSDTPNKARSRPRQRISVFQTYAFASAAWFNMD